MGKLYNRCLSWGDPLMPLCCRFGDESFSATSLLQTAYHCPDGAKYVSEGLTMSYIRRDKANGKLDAQIVYADPATEKIMLEGGFGKASGAAYYNRGFVDVVVYDDGTWEPHGGTGFLAEEWQKMREFAGVQLKDFVPWLKQTHEFMEQYCAKLKPEDYRKEETFTFVKVYKDYTPPFGGECAWFIEHFGLLGSDGVIPAHKKAIPRQYWFVVGKYYESKSVSVPTGDPSQLRIAQSPDLEQVADLYLIERIEAALRKESNHA
jgi:hypothetical protein